ncbi:hypothetical protein Ancab_019024 [Ancistrocladus abbreviatus]
MELRCVQCARKVEKLYVQYSPGNIRLMKCENCKSVADEYIECELMIIVIDLILHKPKAYRHLLFNTLKSSNLNTVLLLFKLFAAFLLVDAHRLLILNTNKHSHSQQGFSWSIYSMSLRMIVNVIFGNLFFFSIFVGLSVKTLNLADGFCNYKDVLFGVLVSSYMKLFMVAMVVWEFPSLVVYIIDVFVMSSNLVALRVISQSSLRTCVGVCFTAHAARLLFCLLLDLCFS